MVRWDKTTPEMQVIDRLATGIMIRTRYKPHGQYKEVENRLGATWSEVRDYLATHFMGDVKQLLTTGQRPSVDRKDSKGHYEHGNIRVIPLSTNCRLSTGNAIGGHTTKMRSGNKVVATYPDGTKKHFDSCRDAGKEFGLSHAAIGRYAKDGLVHKASGVRFTRGII